MLSVCPVKDPTGPACSKTSFLRLRFHTAVPLVQQAEKWDTIWFWSEVFRYTCLPYLLDCINESVSQGHQHTLPSSLRWHGHVVWLSIHHFSENDQSVVSGVLDPLDP